MEKEPNIYKRDIISEEEKKRLSIDIIGSCSREMLGDSLQGKTVLDVGAGPNIILGEYVRSKGGEYIAFDVSESYLREQKSSGALPVQGIVEELPFRTESVDVVHTRLVLMHLMPEQREKALAETIRVSKERSIFMEGDWAGFINEEPSVNIFRDFGFNGIYGRLDFLNFLSMKPRKCCFYALN